MTSERRGELLVICNSPPGILAWAIQGCLDWQREGLVRPAIVTAATNAYFESQDTFKQWLDESCEFGKDFKESVGELSASFRYFVQQSGDQLLPSAKSFSQRMQQHGFKAVRDIPGLRGRGFQGVKLRTYQDGF